MAPDLRSYGQADVPPAVPLPPSSGTVHGSEVFVMEIKALVANSSNEARKNIARTLKSIGVCNVVEAKDGKQAMKLLETGRFDVCFAECTTQIGPNEELIKTIRRTDASMPVVVMGPQSKQIDELKKMYPGASAYLTMPFTAEQLKKTVTACVPSIAV